MSEYWKEFIRVNTDRLILLFVIIYLASIHADERLIYLAIGALAGAIQHNRWQWAATDGRAGRGERPDRQ